MDEPQPTVSLKISTDRLHPQSIRWEHEKVQNVFLTLLRNGVTRCPGIDTHAGNGAIELMVTKPRQEIKKFWQLFLAIFLKPRSLKNNCQSQ
jgi:hypothetical protein